jgi:CII-binding regulator of phage lambda lysogenization HflD
LTVDFGTSHSLKARSQRISLFLTAIITLNLSSFNVLYFFGLIYKDKFGFIEVRCKYLGWPYFAQFEIRAKLSGQNWSHMSWRAFAGEQWQELLNA